MPKPISWKKSEIVTLRGQMEDLFDRFFDQLATWCHGPGMVSPADWQLFEDDQQIVLKIDMPDVNPAEIDVSILEDVLTIKVLKEKVRSQAEEQRLSAERTSSSTVRTVRLPCRVKSDDIEARYVNGVLEIILPKAKVSALKVPIKD